MKHGVYVPHLYSQYCILTKVKSLAHWKINIDDSWWWKQQQKSAERRKHTHRQDRLQYTVPVSLACSVTTANTNLHWQSFTAKQCTTVKHLPVKQWHIELTAKMFCVDSKWGSNSWWLFIYEVLNVKQLDYTLDELHKNVTLSLWS